MLDFEALAQAMGDLDEDTVKEILEAVMADGGTEAGKAMEACQKGMDTVGQLFEEGEYFVGDLIYAGLPGQRCALLPRGANHRLRRLYIVLRQKKPLRIVSAGAFRIPAAFRCCRFGTGILLRSERLRRRRQLR